MARRLSTKLALTAAIVACVAPTTPSSAQTAYASRTTTITGTFRIGTEVVTLKAETRLRAITSATASTTAPPTFSINPAEMTTSVMLCNQAGCAQPSNRICVASPAQIDEEPTGQGKLHIVSTAAGCTVDVMATVSEPRAPQLVGNRLESASSAVFEAGATIQGSTPTSATDGKVLRTVSWFAA